METTQDQRTGQRINVNIPVKIICSNEKSYLAQIINLNDGGFLCLMKKTLPPKTKVHLIMLLPSFQKQGHQQSKVIEGEGIIIRENLKENEQGDIGHAVAVQFTVIQNEHMDSLKLFIEYFSNNFN